MPMNNPQVVVPVRCVDYGDGISNLNADDVAFYYRNLKAQVQPVYTVLEGRMRGNDYDCKGFSSPEVLGVDLNV